MNRLQGDGGQTVGRGSFGICRMKAVRQATQGLRVCIAMCFLGILLSASGCASKEEKGISVHPGQEMRTLFIDRLRSYGFGILDDATLDKVLTRNRVRYTAGVEGGSGRALKDEAGADAILIPSLELYNETYPPKIAIFCRLVSAGDDPAVLWIDGIGLAGDDSPGLLGLGLIEEPWALLTRAVDSLARSLAQHGAGGEEGPKGEKGPRKFRPKIVYRSDGVIPKKKYSIAVVPFFNKSDRRNAGEVVALHMIRNLMAFQNFEIVEPGIVREQLLRYRIIMSDGVSLPDTDTILNAVNADLVLNGEVLDYQDYQGPEGNPKVDFSVLFIEGKTRKVVYSSYSQNTGNDGVIFFDWGRVNTAHAMASQMARAIAERLMMEAERVGTNTASGKQ
jgi:hypothetical protein